MRCALLQMSSGDDPGENARIVRDAIHDAAAGGADLLVTPEVSNCLSTSRSHQRSVLRLERDDETLALAREAAGEVGIHVLLGSLALKTEDADGRFANRSVLIDPQGKITARYDKAHMFDVAVTESETFRESDGYRPGTRAVLGKVGQLSLGLTICYDLRFPSLHRRLAQAGAQILCIPAAFSPVTGAAHWEVLLRARAIETGCFVLAPAQTGTHKLRQGKPRSTFGHSLVVSPWGEVLLDAGTACGISFIDLDLAEVAKSRQRIPSLHSNPELTGP